MIFNKINRKEKEIKVPSSHQLEEEMKRLNYRTRFSKLLRSTIYTLLVVAAAAVLTAVLFMPVLRIYGSSMNPTLNEGEIIVSIKGGNVKRGDVVAFYWGSKLLIKRVIATEHQWVTIDEEGNVYVDGELIDEPYVSEKALGTCNVELPYQVPTDSYFVMGDHRETSVDSRNSSVGCVLSEDIVGKIVFRVWPFADIGIVGK